MPLDEACLQFEGKVAAVVPINGYGWCRYEAAEEIHGEQPRRFDMRIVELWRLDGRICGGLGLVEEVCDSLPGTGIPGIVAIPALKGLSVFFWIRDGWGQGEHNMTTQPAMFDLWIGDGTPKAKVEHAIPSRERAQFDRWPVRMGPAYMAATLTDLKTHASHLGRLLN